jgi:hypothetical protein
VWYRTSLERSATIRRRGALVFLGLWPFTSYRLSLSYGNGWTQQRQIRQFPSLKRLDFRVCLAGRWCWYAPLLDWQTGHVKVWHRSSSKGLFRCILCRVPFKCITPTDYFRDAFEKVGHGTSLKLIELVFRLGILWFTLAR